MCEVVHVLYDYLPSDQPHALKLAAGEIVRVAERSDDGWCLGTVGNHQLERTGWFPASYAAVIQGVQLQAGEYVDQAVRAVLSSGHGDQKLYYTNVNTNETSWQLPIMKSEAQQTPRARNDIQEHIAKAKGEVASTSSTDKISEQVVLRKKSVTSESQKQETIVYTHHSVTFNAGHSSQSQTLLSPDRMSYVDYFWSDKGDETGIDILVGRHIKGKLAVKDMASFMRERAALEEAYARSLSKLANTVFLAADHSDGTVEKAWSSMKKSLQEESSYRSAFAEKLLHEVEQPMLKFKDGQKKERKSFAALLAEGRKQLTSKYATAQRARAGVAAKQRELESRSAIMGDLEDDKRQSEIRKAKRKSVSAEESLRTSVFAYNEVQNKWVENMVEACKAFEAAENDKADFLKSKMGKYGELIRIANISSIKSCDKMMATVQDIDPQHDREIFIRASATGSKRPTDLQF